MSTSLSTAIERAAALLDLADGLIITAGAGMGVDSGLPDFRGTEGFWRAYPALGKASIQFESIACPEAFVEHPRLAWGFYGHRLNLYRTTQPHEGFHLLRQIAASMPRNAFIFTSNVDGQFQKAGFAEHQICEAHGSIHHLQCMQGCAGDIWSAANFQPDVDAPNCILLNDFPTCPHCGGMARPNILMFGDWQWLNFRERMQRDKLNRWLANTQRPVIIEIGAGSHIPTVRVFGHSTDAPLIRINPRKAETRRDRDVSIVSGALDGIYAIADALGMVQ